jgi:hypothetical protein
MTFLYLVPTGMNDPEQPTWGSWAGRYGPRRGMEGKNYYWADVKDDYSGSASRENTLSRWAADLQNDFAARMDWCVADEYRKANHPPLAQVSPPIKRSYHSGETVRLSATGSADPDRQELTFKWICYAEPGTYRGAAPVIRGSDKGASAAFVAPQVQAECTIHIIVAVTDTGTPPLTRYQRVVLTIAPRQ